jgi:hypothetical protein
MDDFIAVSEEILDKIHVVEAKNGEERFLYIIG